MSSAPEVGSPAQHRVATRALRRALGARPYAFPPAQIDVARGAGPVVEVWAGTYAVTGHEACRSVFRDPRLVVEDAATLAERRPTWSEHASMRSFGRELLSLNGSQHARLRAVLAEAFVPPAADRMRLIVTTSAAEVVQAAGAALSAGEPVGLEGVCTAVPSLAIGRLLGLPDGVGGSLAVSSDAFAAALRTDFDDPSDLAGADAAVTSMQDALRPFLAPGAVPDDSLIATLLRERAGLEDVLGTEEALLANVILLWSAGLDTTRSLLRDTLLTLVENRGLAGALRAEPRAATRFLREMERLHPPIPVTTRMTRERTEVLAHDLPAGSRLLLMLDAANRDVPGDPHAYDLAGPARRSVSFGGGARTCLGLPMARLALDRVLAEVLATWPDELRHADGRLRPDLPDPTGHPLI